MPRKEDGKLSTYFEKRTPSTTEPFGEAGEAQGPTLRGAYVVHQHDATRMHFDLRLEIGGVLASFAIPHGFSLEPLEKHLAVHTEDHPLEYLDFEEVIPEGNYGAGAMIAWDRGLVRYLEGPAEEGLRSGKLDLYLSGYKLVGRWALVRLAGEPRNWLLIKKRDEIPRDRERFATLTRSILSGLTVAERGRAPELARAWEEDAAARGAPLRTAGERLTLVVPREGTPRRGAMFDVALGGVRALLVKEQDTIAVLEGGERDVSAFYPELVRAARTWPVARVALDGDIVLFDDAGQPSLPLLARRVERMRAEDPHRVLLDHPVQYAAIDLLALGDRDTRPLPLSARRELLSAMLPDVPGVFRAPRPLVATAAVMRALIAEHRLAAAIAKPPAGPYGDGAGWISLGDGAPGPRVVVDHATIGPGHASRKVSVTNRAKVFWPGEGLTKGDLVAFYTEMAPAILPYLADRPVILVRYPDGVDGKSFFQWRTPPAAPSWLRTVVFVDREDRREKRGFLIDDVAALTYVANLACIPIHILACRAGAWDVADFFTVDFDVKQATLAAAIPLARQLMDWLAAIGLPGRVKTSGQSGLHVLVPLGPGQSFATARGLADLLGRLLVRAVPEAATMERHVKSRGARVFVDTGQTGPSRAIVAPWSVRAAPGATVSTPITRDELGPGLDPRAFTIRTVPARFGALGDPMGDLLLARPDVAAAVERLGALASELGR
jgi:bifunctional non-homologous end joining protein LigD